ncbi:MAG: VanZ family protein [Bacteroidetes bacterium]|nr:VanZ family protein [Bacteroidota bacterium]
MGIIFIGAYIILYGLISKPNIIELLLVIGIISVYLLLFLRLGLPERSHLIEYSALCLTIHEALLERKKQGKQITHIGFWAFAITILIGLIDEIIQIFIPNRVFDVNDILFNCFTAFMAIGVSMSIQYFRQK